MPPGGRPTPSPHPNHRCLQRPPHKALLHAPRQAAGRGHAPRLAEHLGQQPALAQPVHGLAISAVAAADLHRVAHGGEARLDQPARGRPRRQDLGQVAGRVGQRVEVNIRREEHGFPLLVGVVVGAGGRRESREDEEERVEGGGEVEGRRLDCLGGDGSAGRAAVTAGLDQPAARGGLGRCDLGELEEARLRADQVAGWLVVARVLERDDARVRTGGLGEDEQPGRVVGLGGQSVDGGRLLDRRALPVRGGRSGGACLGAGSRHGGWLAG